MVAEGLELPLCQAVLLLVGYHSSLGGVGGKESSLFKFLVPSHLYLKYLISLLVPHLSHLLDGAIRTLLVPQGLLDPKRHFSVICRSPLCLS